MSLLNQQAQNENEGKLYNKTAVWREAVKSGARRGEEAEAQRADACDAAYSTRWPPQHHTRHGHEHGGRVA